MSKIPKVKKSKESKNWCFTDFEGLCIEDIIEKHIDKIIYCCWGQETCPKTQKKHTQGWIQFAKKKRMTAVKKMFGSKKIHLETCKGTEAQNDKYCQKENAYETYGEYTVQGQRVDLEKIYKEIEDGLTELEICRLYPKEHAQFHKAFNRKIKLESDDKAQIELEDTFNSAVLRDWQTTALQKLLTQDNRTVLWIQDRKGNRGKTFLAKYITAIHKAFYIRNGKSADIAYAYNNQQIVVFDFTREQQERINYQSIENFKDGMLFSPKYESTTKIFKPCKVIVFSNFYPDTSMLSEDRWDITVLDDTENTAKCAEVVGNTEPPLK